MIALINIRYEIFFISFLFTAFYRRKPQNLTPPLSSDGGSSSTSGQSPNSQHNGSPPPIVKRPSSQSTSSLNNNMNSKMNYDNEKYMEPVAKKQRISHFSARDGTSYISSRSRDTDDYFR